MIPEPDGFALLPLMEEQGIPCIFLTAKSDVMSRVRGLKAGAEDYIVKPFELMELYARIENVLKRHGKLNSRIEVDRCLIDLTGHKVWEEGREVALKPMEYDLLVFLCQGMGGRIWRGDQNRGCPCGQPAEKADSGQPHPDHSQAGVPVGVKEHLS